MCQDVHVRAFHRFAVDHCSLSGGDPRVLGLGPSTGGDNPTNGILSVLGHVSGPLVAHSTYAMARFQPLRWRNTPAIPQLPADRNSKGGLGLVVDTYPSWVQFTRSGEIRGHHGLRALMFSSDGAQRAHPAFWEVDAGRHVHLETSEKRGEEEA